MKRKVIFCQKSADQSKSKVSQNNLSDQTLPDKSGRKEDSML